MWGGPIVAVEVAAFPTLMQRALSVTLRAVLVAVAGLVTVAVQVLALLLVVAAIQPCLARSAGRHDARCIGGKGRQGSAVNAHL